MYLKPPQTPLVVWEVGQGQLTPDLKLPRDKKQGLAAGICPSTRSHKGPLGHSERAGRPRRGGAASPSRPPRRFLWNSSRKLTP